MSEAKTLLEALLAFQKDGPTVHKDAVNPHFKNRYVSLDSLTQTITPLLSAHGLVWTTMPCHDDAGPALRYRLAHVASGEAIEGVMPLMLSKNDPQGQGSAITYARRYAISAVLGLSAEDDDGNAGSQRQTQAQTSIRTPALVTAEDIAELKAAANDLPGEKIKLAFAASGIPFTGTWSKVRKTEAPGLIKALAGVER